MRCFRNGYTQNLRSCIRMLSVKLEEWCLDYSVGHVLLEVQWEVATTKSSWVCTMPYLFMLWLDS